MCASAGLTHSPLELLYLLVFFLSLDKDSTIFFLALNVGSLVSVHFCRCRSRCEGGGR